MPKSPTMGMFDTVHCDYPLPDPRHQGLEFQTKDLESLMLHFTITKEGRLLQHSWRRDEEPRREVEWPVHRDVSIYTSVENPAHEHGREWVEYVVRYRHLEAPPNPLPSGYAALLCLFGLR